VWLLPVFKTHGGRKGKGIYWCRHGWSKIVGCTWEVWNSSIHKLLEQWLDCWAWCMKFQDDLEGDNINQKV
jgi:hypothetical protein